MTPKEQLADYIESGDVGGGKNNWCLAVVYPVRYTKKDIQISQLAIANFVRDGVMEGSFPTWKVTVASNVDLSL